MVPEPDVPWFLHSQGSKLPESYIFMAPCFHGPVFWGLYVPRTLCSHDPMFSGLCVLKTLCSMGPIFLEHYIPKVLHFHNPMFLWQCSEDTIFPEPNVSTALGPNIPRVLCFSIPCVLMVSVLRILCPDDPIFLCPNVLRTLCPQNSMFLGPCVPRVLHSHGSMFPAVCSCGQIFSEPKKPMFPEPCLQGPSQDPVFWGPYVSRGRYS